MQYHLLYIISYVITAPSCSEVLLQASFVVMVGFIRVLGTRLLSCYDPLSDRQTFLEVWSAKHSRNTDFFERWSAKHSRNITYKIAWFFRISFTRTFAQKLKTPMTLCWYSPRATRGRYLYTHNLIVDDIATLGIKNSYFHLKRKCEIFILFLYFTKRYYVRYTIIICTWMPSHIKALRATRCV